MSMRRIRSTLAAAFVGVVVVGLGGVAIGETGWVTSTMEGPQSDTHSGEEPVESIDTDVARQLVSTVSELPGFPTDVRPISSKEVTNNEERMVIASFQSPDGGLIDVVMQRLPRSLPLEVLDPTGNASQTAGPNGEIIVLVDKGHTLQAVAISTDGIMANVIVERINRVEIGRPSVLLSLSPDVLTDWAVSLLSALGGEL